MPCIPPKSEADYGPKRPALSISRLIVYPEITKSITALTKGGIGIKITVIGCWGAYPKAGEATAGFLLETGNHRILLDCGSGVVSSVQKFTALPNLTSVFVSHQHYDHMADLGCLQYACLIDTDLNRRIKPLPLLLAGAADLPWTVPSYKGTEAHAVNEHTVLTYEDGLRLSFFRTNHDGYCLGIRAEAQGKVFVYTADTRYDESLLLTACSGADLLLAECSFSSAFDAGRFGHMNTHEAGRLASKSGAKRLMITHLPHFGDIGNLAEEVKEAYSGEVVLAQMGLTVEV